MSWARRAAAAAAAQPPREANPLWPCGTPGRDGAEAAAKAAASPGLRQREKQGKPIFKMVEEDAQPSGTQMTAQKDVEKA